MKVILHKLNAFAFAFALQSLIVLAGPIVEYIPFYNFYSNYFSPAITVAPVTPTVVTRLIDLATKIVEGYFCPYRKVLQVVGKQDLKEVNRFCENIGEVCKVSWNKIKESYEFISKNSKRVYEFISDVSAPIFTTDYTFLKLYLSIRRMKKVDKKQIKKLVGNQKRILNTKSKKETLADKNEICSEIANTTKDDLPIKPVKKGKPYFLKIILNNLY